MIIVGVRVGNSAIMSYTFVDFTIFVKVWFEDSAAAYLFAGMQAFRLHLSNV